VRRVNAHEFPGDDIGTKINNAAKSLGGTAGEIILTSGGLFKVTAVIPAGCTLRLHRCSIYDSKEAGQRLNAMLTMGQSRPWQEALETLTGSKQMDASAIIDYFAPLKQWLDEQTKGQPIGW